MKGSINMAITVTERGRVLLRDPLLNKDTAFSEKERDALHLNGLLPNHRETIDEQLLRCNDAYSAKKTP